MLGMSEAADGLFESPSTEAGVRAGTARGTATKALLAVLERHYIKAGTEEMPGGVFVPEVGFNGPGGNRRADAIYIGFTAASGRLMIGHELKVTRSDWLRELDEPVKSCAWSEQCHEWWIVAVPGVVKRDEVPAEWGLMEPPRGSRGRRMRVVKPAERFHGRQPSWDVCRSVLARWDTLRAKVIRDSVDEVRRDAQERISAARQLFDENSAERAAQETLRKLAEALGGGRHVLIDDSTPVSRFGVVSLADVERVGALIQSEVQLGQYVARIQDGFRSPLGEVRGITAGLERALNGLAAVGRELEQGGRNDG